MDGVAMNTTGEGIAASRPEGPEPLAALKATTSLVYLLQALSFVLGVTSIFGVIINYIRFGDARGTWLESHFVWQLRTFWFQLAWGLVGLVTSVILIGFLIWGGVYLWTLYRVVKGWVNLADNRPMYAD
jgi:uncharacterized membrane protein